MIPRPVYHDLWGYPIDWTDPSDGWNDDIRKIQITLTNSILAKSTSRKKFSEIGYMKTKIPTQLYQHILKQRQRSVFKYEDCQPYHNSIQNCYEITSNV